MTFSNFAGPDHDSYLCGPECRIKHRIGIERHLAAGEDIGRHVDRSDCWCRPTRDYVDPVTNIEVWVHRKERN